MAADIGVSLFDGFRELNRTFKHAPKDVRREIRDEYRTVAEPVRSTASTLAVSSDPPDAVLAQVGEFRTGVTQTMVYVAPKKRGVKGRGSDPRRRPNLGNLLAERALEPALEQHEHRIEADFDRMLGRLVPRLEHTMARKLVVRIVGDSQLDRACVRAVVEGRHRLQRDGHRSLTGASLKRQAAGVATGVSRGRHRRHRSCTGCCEVESSRCRLQPERADQKSTGGVRVSPPRRSGVDGQRRLRGDRDRPGRERWPLWHVREPVRDDGGSASDNLGRHEPPARPAGRRPAAFNNTNPTEALDALRSGLVGEADRCAGTASAVRSAAVQQAAMAETGRGRRTRQGAERSRRRRLPARYRIILADTTTAQGNFKDTSEGFAQQTKILKAEVRDLSADIGNLLTPQVTDLVVSHERRDRCRPRPRRRAHATSAKEIPLPNFIKDNADKLLYATVPGADQGWATTTLGFLNDQARRDANQRESGLAAKRPDRDGARGRGRRGCGSVRREYREGGTVDGRAAPRESSTRASAACRNGCRTSPP